MLRAMFDQIWSLAVVKDVWAKAYKRIRPWMFINGVVLKILKKSEESISDGVPF